MEEKKKRSNYNPKAMIKYQQTHLKRYYLNCTDTTDADIVQKLESVENKQGYIKQLIRDDIKRGGQ